MSAPDLVYINPSVQVIADYDEPIFYSSNYYWRSEGAVWYRSSNYRSGWVRVETAPAVIQQIDRPTAYIHYHPPAVEAAASASAAARHDGGSDAHERRDERHDEKAEQRQGRKEDRKEERKEDHDDKAPKRH